jgi:hypothetical protein
VVAKFLGRLLVMVKVVVVVGCLGRGVTTTVLVIPFVVPFAMTI